MDVPTRPTVEVFTTNVGDMGVARPNGTTFIDANECTRSPAVCLFVRVHEQDHHELGASEHAADCYAARNAPAYAVRAAIERFMTNPRFGDAAHGTGLMRGTGRVELFQRASWDVTRAFRCNTACRSNRGACSSVT